MPRQARANKLRDPNGTILPPGIRYRARDQTYIVEIWSPKYEWGGQYPTLPQALNALTAAQKRADGKGQLPEPEEWIRPKARTQSESADRLTETQKQALDSVPTKATRIVRVTQRSD